MAHVEPQSPPREMSTLTVTWPNAVAGFALVIWLVPARGYRLPITLPFHLEAYRIVLGALMLALLVAVTEAGTLEFLGFGIPLAILAGTATLSAMLNYQDLGRPPAMRGPSSRSRTTSASWPSSSSSPRRSRRRPALTRSSGRSSSARRSSPSRRSTSPARATTRSTILPNGFPASFASRGRSSPSAAGISASSLGTASHRALGGALYGLPARPLPDRPREDAGTWHPLGIAAAVCAMGAVATISRTTVIMAGAILAVGFWLRPGRSCASGRSSSSSDRHPLRCAGRAWRHLQRVLAVVGPGE